MLVLNVEILLLQMRFFISTQTSMQSNKNKLIHDRITTEKKGNGNVAEYSKYTCSKVRNMITFQDPSRPKFGRNPL